MLMDLVFLHEIMQNPLAAPFLRITLPSIHVLVAIDEHGVDQSGQTVRRQIASGATLCNQPKYSSDYAWVKQIERTG